MVLEETLHLYRILPFLNRFDIWKFSKCFDPERFPAEIKKLRDPITYLLFGTCPRKRNVMRGLLQSKVALVHLAAYKQTPQAIKFMDMENIVVAVTDNMGIQPGCRHKDSNWRQI
uniref:Uncharacterized protein n=1 Tax=Glossina pallidipes TaxID=7398 RepID=A0A1A9ZGM0_GLOPL